MCVYGSSLYSHISYHTFYLRVLFDPSSHLSLSFVKRPFPLSVWLKLKVPLCHGTKWCVCARPCWTVMCLRQWEPKCSAKTGSRMCFRTAGVLFTGYIHTNRLIKKATFSHSQNLYPLGCECVTVAACDLPFSAHRFVSACTPSVDELERGALVNGIQKFFCGAPPDRYSV